MNNEQFSDKEFLESNDILFDDVMLRMTIGAGALYAGMLRRREENEARELASYESSQLEEFKSSLDSEFILDMETDTRSILDTHLFLENSKRRYETGRLLGLDRPLTQDELDHWDLYDCLPDDAPWNSPDQD